MTKQERLLNEQKIIKLSKEGNGITDISKLLKVSKPFVSRLFKKNNIFIDKRGGLNKKIDFNPFLPLTSESYYWIGFLAADGNISKRKKAAVSLSQGGNNKIHMLAYHKFLKYKPTIHYSNNKITILFGNTKVSNWLKSIGIVPKKSFILNLNIDLNWDIVRGYFDGDGGFYRNDKHHTFIIKFTSGSLSFLHKLQLFLNKENISSKIISETNSIHRLTIPAKSRYKFIYLLYKNAETYMLRKRIIADKYIRSKTRIPRTSKIL